MLQEPGPAAAKALRAEWEQRFKCGPAYVIGDDRSVRLIAINYGKPVLGLAFEDTARADWLDKTRLANLGAMIVATPDLASRPDLTAWFKGRPSRRSRCRCAARRKQGNAPTCTISPPRRRAHEGRAQGPVETSGTSQKHQSAEWLAGRPLGF